MARALLEPNLWNIRTLFENKIFEIPVYQRSYSWNGYNISVLVDDILNAFNNGYSASYYTGNIVICESNKKIDGNIRVYDIVDGQQRITTFILILLSLYSLFDICSNLNDPDNNSVMLYMKKLLWRHKDTRHPEKEYPSLRLNSIEKRAFSDLYDYAFDKPEALCSYAKNYNCRSDYEKNIIENFKIIYEKLKDQFLNNEDNFLDFVSYVEEKVCFINIEYTDNENKVFSIFESINSKGKPLEEIDKIKCYIFSELDENSYNNYLQRWGDLIIQTKDNLYEYLMVYIRSYIKYYRQDIKLANFKTIAEDDLKVFFNKNDLNQTFKALLDDMFEKVKYYNMLSDIEALRKLCKNAKLLVYYKLFSGYYRHPKPLFFRLLIEYVNQKVSEDDFVTIFVTVMNFMMESLTFLNKESKDVITMLINIFDDIYINGIDLKTITFFIAKESIKSNITKDILKQSLISYDAYNHKNISVPLLALYEAYDDKKNKLFFKQAELLVSKFHDSFSLDHLLVQKPEQDDANYKYYCDEDNDYKLVLKSGNDFPTDKVFDGMPYKEFKEQILNKFGNVRIYYRDKNSSRQNNIIELKDYGTFTKYEDIKNREERIVNFFIEKILTIPSMDQADEPKKSKKSPAKFPKVDELIDAGVISLGDRMYINSHPNNSESCLISPKNVIYQGKTMSLNKWGQTVTGWSSINIYDYACIVGETETLNEKRKLLIDT